jgi:transposase
MHVESWQTKDELAAMIRGEKDARVATRLRAVLLALKGRTHREISDDLAVSPRSVQSWVERYNASGAKGGVDALRDRPRPGQPKRLTPDEEHTLVAWLEKGPDLERDGVVAWRGPTLVDKIHAHFGKRFSLSGAYALLHRLGFEPLRPRPIHRKADRAAQEEFRKAAPLFWSRSAATTPGRSSRSGSRTR